MKDTIKATWEAMGFKRITAFVSLGVLVWAALNGIDLPGGLEDLFTQIIWVTIGGNTVGHAVKELKK